MNKGVKGVKKGVKAVNRHIIKSKYVWKDFEHLQTHLNVTHRSVKREVQRCKNEVECANGVLPKWEKYLKCVNEVLMVSRCMKWINHTKV